MAKTDFIVDINLNNNQLLNATLQNLATAPSLTGRIAGFAYWNTTDKTAYVYSGKASPDEWLDLGKMYTHPTQEEISNTFSGATVLATLTFDAQGHVSAVSTRQITLSDIGYTGASDANKYIHATFGASSVGPLTGTVVISGVIVNSEGHVTSVSTRSLTNSDLTSLIINDSVTNFGYTWSGEKIANELALLNNTISGGLINKGGYDASSNTPLLDATPIAGIKNGWTYVITTPGLFFNSENVQIGDMIIAKQDNPTSIDHWTVVNKNIADIVSASTSVQGIVQLATDAETIAGTDTTKAVTPAGLKALLDARTGGYAVSFGDDVSTSFDVSHGLNSVDVNIDVFDTATGETVYMQVRRSSISTVNLQCNTPPLTNQYRVTIKK